ncbi:MAG TPA: hypothetical protein VF742_13160, partial [Terracidiphilus sp.]
NKVNPRTITGHIGHNRNLKFQREWQVRTVCRSCNEGWMSGMEDAMDCTLGLRHEVKEVIAAR